MSVPQRDVHVGDICFSNRGPVVFILGPCQMESEDHVLFMAECLKEISESLKVPIIFKSSFDKANRTSLRGARGLGLEKALDVFSRLKQEFSLPIITDVHTEEQCVRIAPFVDILQIPAFLCRQTDLLVAAAKTGKAINIKKGQFLAPWDMKNVVEKCEAYDNERLLLCERGTSFGYNNLVTDMRALPIMAKEGYPVIFDATHSVQKPGGQGDSSGGERQYVEILARAAVAVGVAGIFIETHDNPDMALSDGPNMIKLSDLPEVLKRLRDLDHFVKNYT